MTVKNFKFLLLQCTHSLRWCDTCLVFQESSLYSVNASLRTHWRSTLGIRGNVAEPMKTLTCSRWYTMLRPCVHWNLSPLTPFVETVAGVIKDPPLQLMIVLF